MAIERRETSEKFSLWFRKVLSEAEIVDYRYPVKGCGVWLPYGFQLRQNIISVIRGLLNKTGHEECLFPIFIPEDSFARETAHIKGLETEVFWVTHAGARKLDVKLILRPTSETVIAPMLKLWIRSHADLPKKLYQVVNIFRYETKATWPIVRVREVTTFKEAHTAHATSKDAEEQVREGVEVYKRFFDCLCLSYTITDRPDWDRFPGALCSTAFETVLPDGKTLQIGTVHNLGQNFSKAFDLTFEKEDGSRDYLWQTCYGISERVIAAIIAVHGDDRGLVLPPSIAPIQVVIVPIPYKGFEEKIKIATDRVEEKIGKIGLKVSTDNREGMTPGAKFYQWEIKGVPIRVEVGPKDIEKGVVTIVRRDTLEKSTCSEDRFEETVKSMLAAVEKALRDKTWAWLRAKIKSAETVEEAAKLLKKGSGIVELNWCGAEDCGLKVEEKTGGRVLGTPVDKTPTAGRCAVCGKSAKTTIRVSKAY